MHLRIACALLLCASLGIQSAGHPQPDSARTSGAISFVSLNIAKETDPEVVLKDWGRYPELQDTDVFLLQEVVHPGGDQPGIAHGIAQRLGYQVAFAPAAANVVNQGLAILSRYPIHDVQVTRLKRHHLVLRSRWRIALAATIDTPSGPVRVVNTHLDSRINAGDRLEQLEPAVPAQTGLPLPRVVGGDLNTNNMYWIFHLLPLPFVHPQGKAVTRMMQEHGYSSPFGGDATFDHLGQRLDWIWVKHLETRASTIHPMNFSDHHAIRLEVLAPPSSYASR
jgi:endonuclease/exonuclease/phosphatase family metal-dependent hydrolase